MQFGIREICDVVFKAKGAGKVGSMPVRAGQPVLYIDSAKTSTMEGAATTVYAQGGRGNTRLIAWEGERTLTFTVEDALLSELGFAILSGAGLFDKNGQKSYVHQTAKGVVTGGQIDLTPMDEEKHFKIHNGSPIYAMIMQHGSIKPTGLLTGLSVDATGMILTGVDPQYNGEDVFVDFYIVKTKGVTEMTIDMENFAGYYYVEASTLFRRQSDGKDLPAELIFPNVKVQSNFTFSMASTGDPSTFTFTMDAMPGYTRFDRNRKVLCAMQIIDEEAGDNDVKDDSIQQLADADKEYPLITDDTVAVKCYTPDGYVCLDTIVAIKGTDVILPALTAPKGVEFTGWTATKGGTTAIANDKLTAIAADTAVYAIFTAVEAD
jgi:hypothetical protein